LTLHRLKDRGALGFPNPVFSNHPTKSPDTPRLDDNIVQARCPIRLIITASNPDLTREEELESLVRLVDLTKYVVMGLGLYVALAYAVERAATMTSRMI
jgi:hypothetical protein